ncbi:MAG: hypothetical protein LQ352_002243 [Teloschistes flavicans]|nr:MAG: hypothetical protein LQ352_002243 [Teloschistes flavicans]
MSHALASILEASAATASGREEASNRTHKDSATTIPAHLRQDAPADELRQTTGVATVDAASETQEAAHRQPRSSTHISEAISYDRPKPVMGTLIEEQPLPTMDYPKSPSNMEDLLGLQFEKTNLYVVPVQSSVNTNSTVNPLAAAVTQPMAQNLTSTSTSYLSILKNSNYSPAFLTGIQSILAQRNETSGESVARQDTHATRGSLAEAVQRNTIQWQQQVIQGTVPSTPSILGDSVVRNRFHRWYDSADSVNSMASEESALTHLPGLHRSRSGTQSTRANRSGSGLTSMGPSRSVASTDVSPPRRPTALSTSAPRGPRPQLPAFLESAPHYDDPAAAARAQYSGRTAALQASPTARIVPTPPNLPGAARTRTRTQGTLDENASVSSGDAASGRSLVMGSRNEIVPSQHGKLR